MMIDLRQIKPLTDDERIECVERARAIVVRAVGDAPSREQFANATISHYPRWFTSLIGALLAVLFVAAGLPSFFRLFTAGRDYFLHGIGDPVQAALVGLSTFILAETLIIASTIAARVYFVGKERRMFIVPIVMGLLMALVGNWYVTQPYDVFGWLETLVPPFAVLFIALIGERLILDAIETRHANEIAYGRAHAEWKLATHDPEKHPRYMAAYANTLRRKLIEVQSIGNGAKARGELMQQLSTDDWRALVRREMQADEWYTNHEVVIDTPAPKGGGDGASLPFGNTAPVLAVPESMATSVSSNGNGYGANGNGHV